MKLALITPKNKNDYLTDTVLDGLIDLKDTNNIDFKISSRYPCHLNTGCYFLEKKDFLKFANEADAIILFWGKNNTDFDLVKKINKFDKTIFIDGSEVGKNKRYDFDIQNSILNFTYNGNGRIDKEMLEKCALYFRREKPYLEKIIPLPFGIENSYKKFYSSRIKKDIDLFCVFGQEEFPTMRKYCKEILINFCKKNNLSFFIEKTKDKESFYKTLARSKVGISVGGGGFDTARFWEILANNCILLTEKIDIYEPDSKKLDYNRIWQFSNLLDFQYQLEKIGDFLRIKYKQEEMFNEYKKIISEHSSKSRVEEIIFEARNKKILK